MNFFKKLNSSQDQGITLSESDKINEYLEEIERLKVSEFRLGELVKVSPAMWDMVVDVDDPVGGNNVFWWSNEFREMLGYSNESDFPNVLSSWSDRLHKDDKQRTLAAFSAHMMDKTGITPYDIEYRLFKKNGEQIWAHATGSTLRASDGSPIRVFGTAQNITHKVRNEELNAHIEQFTSEIKSEMNDIAKILEASDILKQAQMVCLEKSKDSEMKVVDTKKLLIGQQAIAKQANILSINALIEAAHAGDAGIGFSVVANGLKEMAGQSGDAAVAMEQKVESVLDSSQSITKEIEKSVALVIEQVNLVTRVKTNMNDILNGYTKIIDLIQASQGNNKKNVKLAQLARNASIGL